MKSRKKLKLKVKKENNSCMLFVGEKPFKSPFCLTDNLTYCFFGLPEQFFVDNRIDDVVLFDTTENDLRFTFDRATEVLIENLSVSTSKENMGSVMSKQAFDLFIQMNNGKKCYYCPVTSWFGKESNRLIAVLPEKNKKPLGILKVKKEI